MKRGGKKIDFSALKTIAIEHVKTMTKEKLTREAYVDSVVKPITTKYSKLYVRQILQHSRVENLITRLLQKEGMLDSVVKPITTKYSNVFRHVYIDRVENLITRLLQKEGMLESKASSKSVFEGGKTYTVWPREYEIK